MAEKDAYYKICDKNDFVGMEPTLNVKRPWEDYPEDQIHVMMHWKFTVANEIPPLSYFGEEYFSELIDVTVAFEGVNHLKQIILKLKDPSKENVRDLMYDHLRYLPGVYHISHDGSGFNAPGSVSSAGTNSDTPINLSHKTFFSNFLFTFCPPAIVYTEPCDYRKIFF